MLAQLQTLAVKQRIPAEALADRIHTAIQVPAAVGHGVKQLVLPPLGLEVCHAHAHEAQRHAPGKQRAEKLQRRREQQFFIIGRRHQFRRAIHRVKIGVAQAERQRARLAAGSAQCGSDAFGEVLDETREEFEIDGPALHGRFARNGFGLERGQDRARVQAAGAFVELPADGLAERGHKRRQRHVAQLADGLDAALSKRDCVCVADAVQLRDGQRSEELLLGAQRNDAEAARALEPRRHRRHQLRRGRSHGNAQAGFLPNALLHPPQCAGEVRIEPVGASEVEVEVIERGDLDRRREGFQQPPDAPGVVGIVFVLPGHDNRLGTKFPRLTKTHRRAHPARLGFVAGRGHHAAAHQHGFSAQARVEHLFDRGEEGVHVHVNDLRCTIAHWVP